MEMKQVIAALGALAQESRLAIYRHLVQAGPEGRPAGAIGERLAIAPATLSFHLKELTRAGLLQSRAEGRFVHYRADYAQMNALLAYLTENCCAGSACAPASKPKGRKS
jgi:ArsR family transcriptional regulator, arsenate/arsenite/antimonite-responsive transcriptional repressor